MKRTYMFIAIIYLLAFSLTLTSCEEKQDPRVEYLTLCEEVNALDSLIDHNIVVYNSKELSMDSRRVAFERVENLLRTRKRALNRMKHLQQSIKL